MIPGVNPKQMKQMMKKMGMKQEDIDASEVIIKCSDKEIVIRNPEVAKIEMMGKENFQISGDVEERGLETFNEDDVNTVKEQTNCSEEEAKEALERNEGDLAKAILELKS
ncbi:MAG: nascent polypeptide-associated complex protein [Nanoarchaeota archaeon]|nr:nascent polypeptide-associated complex protein [Nanoarchaeota archaeon]